MHSTPSLWRGRQGLVLWREQLQDICGRFEPRAPEDARHFFGGIGVSPLGGMDVVTVMTNAPALRRSGADARHDGQEHYFLIYQQAGSSVLQQHDRQAHLRTGDCALIDSRYASEFNYLEDTHHLSFHLTCDAMERRLGGRHPRVCETIRAEGPLGTVLGGFIRQVTAQQPHFDTGEGLAMGDALLSLLAPMAQESQAVPGTPREYARVLAYIEAHLQDDLTPAYIACAVGVSVRSLYRLFEERGNSLGAHVRVLRLQRCAEQLQARGHRDENLTSIAYRWGFKDSAHFSRSFRAQYGLSPSDYRRAASPINSQADSDKPVAMRAA